MLRISEEELPEEELKKHLETAQRMKEGKEGISWDEFKKKAVW